MNKGPEGCTAMDPSVLNKRTMSRTQPGFSSSKGITDLVIVSKFRTGLSPHAPLPATVGLTKVGATLRAFSAPSEFTPLPATVADTTIGPSSRAPRTPGDRTPLPATMGDAK